MNKKVGKYIVSIVGTIGLSYSIIYAASITNFGQSANPGDQLTTSWINSITTEVSNKSNTASPTFTGIPRAPTPASTDSGTTLATTAFVKGQGYLTGGSLVAESDPQVGTNVLNYLSKWDGSSLIQSLLYDGGTGVGINTNFPTAGLDVQYTGLATQPYMKVGNMTMDSAQGMGLFNLVAGAGFAGSSTGYTYLNTRGASRLQLHDGNLGLYVGSGTVGTTGSGVTWNQVISGGQNNTVGIGQNNDIYVNAGNVGIGTLYPGGKLDVQGGRAFIAPNSEQYGLGVKYNTSGGAVYFGAKTASATPDAVISNAGGGDLMTLQNGGNVGIGTPSPGRKLEVNNTLKLSNSSTDPNDGVIGTAPFAAGLNLVGINTDTTGRKVNFWGSLIQNENPVGNTLGLTYFPGSGVWNNSGNVGIGTTGPSYKLDVAGDIRSQGNILMNSNFGKGLIGLYDSYKYQGLFSMGAAYLLSADGSTPGNLYGLAWTHSNAGGQSKAGLQHQLLVMMNGITYTALGSGIRTQGYVTIDGGRLQVKENAAGVYSFIEMFDDESPVSGKKYIHANSNLIGFLGSAASWLTYWDNAGNQVNTGGATFGGNVTASAPTAANHVATKAYVDAAVASAGGSLKVYKVDGTTLLGSFVNYDYPSKIISFSQADGTILDSLNYTPASAPGAYAGYMAYSSNDCTGTEIGFLNGYGALNTWYTINGSYSLSASSQVSKFMGSYKNFSGGVPNGGCLGYGSPYTITPYTSSFCGAGACKIK